MTAISRSRVNIYIVPANTAPSALAATDIYKGDIQSYEKSGAEKDVETVPVFGGFVDKEKPIEQGEISMSIIPSLDSGMADRWDKLAYTTETVSGKTVYTMATEGLASTSFALPVDRMVVIEALKGTEYKTIAYNNCSVTVLDVSHEADDNREYELTMKFSPTNGKGVSNFMTGSLAATALPAWTALNNNA